MLSVVTRPPDCTQLVWRWTSSQPQLHSGWTPVHPIYENSSLCTKWFVRTSSKCHWSIYHRGWTPFFFMYDPKCSTTIPWCTINAPVAFAWCTINAPAVFAWCTNQFVHKVEFSYIGWNGVHTLWFIVHQANTTGAFIVHQGNVVEHFGS